MSQGLDIERVLDRTGGDLCTAIDHLIEAKSLSSRIDQILSNENLLREISLMSYKHRNGFYKIVLAEYESIKLRFHIWPKNTERKEEDIHNHCWDFCSQILAGGYISEEYSVLEDGSQASNGKRYSCYEYLPREEKQYFRLKEIGSKLLSRTISKTLQKGDKLMMSFDRLHRVVPQNSVYTASMFLNGRKKVRSTMVCRAVPEQQKEIEAISLVSSELEFLLKELKMNLTANGE